MSNLKPVNYLTLLAVFSAAVLLAACVSGRSAPDTYTSSSGAVTSIETDRESCTRTCNNDFERCGDRKASAPSPYGASAMPSTFDVQADCRDALKTCLDHCKGR